MEKIEATNWGMIAFRQNIQAMRLQGKYIMSTLNDMKDYQALRMGQFRKSMISFNLKDTLEDIKEMIKHKAEQNNNIINFDPIFKQNDDIINNFVREI